MGLVGAAAAGRGFEGEVGGGAVASALTWFAALTRAREAGRRDAIFNLLDPLDGPGRCGGSRPRLRR